MFGDWMEKYEYIISLGKELAPLAPEDKVDENLIKDAKAACGLPPSAETMVKLCSRQTATPSSQRPGRTDGPRPQPCSCSGHRLSEVVLSR